MDGGLFWTEGVERKVNPDRVNDKRLDWELPRTGQEGIE